MQNLNHLNPVRAYRVRNVAMGLTVEGKPRVRPPSRWPLLDKQSHAAYMREWRKARKEASA